MQTTQQTLPGTLRAAAVRFASHEAVADGNVHLTYEHLLTEVQTVARAYLSLGLQKEDRVAVWAPNSWQWVVAALAVTYAGGILVPVNTRYTGHEALEVIDRTNATVVVVADGFLARSQYDELIAAGLSDVHAVVRLHHPGSAASTSPEAPETPVRARPGRVVAGRVVDWGSLHEIAASVSIGEVEACADAVGPDDVADILFTSGTTGRSKGACSSHRQVVSVAQAWADCGEVTDADRYLVVNPFFHSFGYKAGIVVCLLTGATVVPQSVFDADGTLRLITDEQISVLPGAPAIYQALLENPHFADSDISSLRLAVTGAATVPVALVERMQTAMGFDTVLTAYGLTEAVVATMCRPGDHDTRVANTCGRAAAGLEVRIASPDGDGPLPVEAEGEVLLRGANVMVGYLDDPDATQEAIDADGWLHTGDVGRLDEDGYLKITDRLKDMFIVGGFNVYPAEVEQVLARLEGVVESAVVGVPHHRLGEVGKAFVVRRSGSPLDQDVVLSHAKERLANFKVPREIEFVETLPRNPSGKVLKRELRSMS